MRRGRCARKIGSRARIRSSAACAAGIGIGTIAAGPFVEHFCFSPTMVMSEVIDSNRLDMSSAERVRTQGTREMVSPPSTGRRLMGDLRDRVAATRAARRGSHLRSRLLLGACVPKLRAYGGDSGPLPSPLHL